MKVPLLDLKAQYSSIREETRNALDEILDSQYFIGGPKVEEIERRVAEYSEVKGAVGVSSGTDALIASLMGLGIFRSPLDRDEPDEVIIPAYTFFATAGCVWRVGAKPVFCDIDPDTFNLDPDQLESKITPKTKAIIPVHLFGQVARMEEIKRIADSHGLKIVEDGAQAIGAVRNGLKVGNFGDCAALSFFPTKNLGGIGDGGMVISNDEALLKKVREIRNHGMEPKYFHKHVGGNFRLDAIQAAALLVKLPHLDDWGRMRRQNAAFYDLAFSEVPEIKTPKILPENYSIYNQYVVCVPNRDECMEKLKAAGIGCEIYYPLALHMQECFAPLGYKKGDMPNSEYAAAHSLALPIYPELGQERLEAVAKALKEAVARK